MKTSHTSPEASVFYGSLIFSNVLYDIQIMSRKTIDHPMYGFTGVINGLAVCWGNTRKAFKPGAVRKSLSMKGKFIVLS